MRSGLEMSIKEQIVDLITTDREQIYDEWRELKAFFAGMLIASIIWILAWISMRC